MANGKAHAAAATGVIVLYAIICAALISMAVVRPVMAILLSSGLIIGLYATPDVRDQANIRNHGEWLFERHLGRFAGLCWSLLWLPLAWLIPHRSWLSHLPLVATILAAAWLYWLPLVLVWLFAPAWFDLALWLCLWTLPGWVVQDTVHLAQDGWKVKF